MWDPHVSDSMSPRMAPSNVTESQSGTQGLPEWGFRQLQDPMTSTVRGRGPTPLTERRFHSVGL
jgi:hypothetical protein